MKVTCVYCDSYVDVTDNKICPCCGAPLGEAIEAEEEKLKKEQEEAEKKAAEEAAAKAEEEKQAEIKNTIKGVAVTLGSALLGGGLASGISSLTNSRTRRYGPGGNANAITRGVGGNSIFSNNRSGMGGQGGMRGPGGPGGPGGQGGPGGFGGPGMGRR